MKQLLTAAALVATALGAHAGTNALTGALSNVTISFTDLNPSDAFVPVTGATWRDIVSTARWADPAPSVLDLQQAEAGVWADRQMLSTGAYADGGANATLAFVNGVGAMAAQLSHVPQAGPAVQVTSGASRSVPAPLDGGSPQGLLVLAPYSAVTLSADYLLSYQLDDFGCFADASCTYAALDASLLITERLREPWQTSFSGADARHILLDARQLDAGTPLTQWERGHLSLTFTNDTAEFRHALAEVSFGLALGVQPALAVPEPATSLLCLAGLGGLVLNRRRRAAAEGVTLA